MNYLGAIINFPNTEAAINKPVNDGPTFLTPLVTYNGIQCATIGQVDNKTHIIPLSPFNDIGNGPGKPLWINKTINVKP